MVRRAASKRYRPLHAVDSSADSRVYPSKLQYVVNRKTGGSSMGAGLKGRMYWAVMRVASRVGGKADSTAWGFLVCL